LKIDLHIHSTASDGSLPPAAVVDAARAGGLHIIALADHDTIAGVAPAQQAAYGILHVIPALELSTHHNGAELHMLGYFVDLANAALVQYAERARNARALRMREMIERLDAVGVRIEFEDVLAAAGERAHSLGRPHLARAMLQRGYVSTVSDAFDRYIGDNCPAFVPTRLISPAEAIELIHAAVGVAVWAHPRTDQLAAELSRFIEWGLDGVECYRPRVPHADSERMVALTRDAGLLVTGGSDWHGDWQGHLGEFALERDDVTAFLDAGGI
jgi:predicted metal-dependent phosphoesterase TrpH